MTRILQLAFISAFAATFGVQAATFSGLLLTPSGANTNFRLTGTYPPDVSSTSYSSPNGAFQVTFQLPTVPTVFSFIDSADGIFAIDTDVTLNGRVFPGSEIAFFTPFLDGGLDVCLSEGCSPDPPTRFIRFVTSGDQLFSGSVSNPTFISGAAYIDPSQSFLESPVPEPASLSLSCIGISFLVTGILRRKRRKMRPVRLSPISVAESSW